MCQNIDVLLVNLISENYLARYQAPLAINVLSSYYKSLRPDSNISTLDMQDIFKNISNDSGSVKKLFSQTINTVVTQIKSLCSSRKLIIGLSVKWGTQDVAGEIVSRVMQESEGEQPLFVIGNIGSTHGYLQLLNQTKFSNVVAVIGEGEEALVEISKIADKNIDDFRNLNNYKDIFNVAVCIDGNIKLKGLKRIDSMSYPSLLNIEPSDIYDQEWDVYAIETSRGCSWGNCSFCSIKKQFGENNKPENKELNWNWRPFPIQKVLDDISGFAKKGVRRFDVKDSEFFGPVGTAQDFSETMERVSKFAYGLISINEELRNIDDLVQSSTLSVTHISARVGHISHRCVLF